ncbi:MAG: ABC transporter ATP-binding protein, partial [Flavisolibacter sp.]
IQKGEFISIVGKSGCGKSTLLYVLSTMDTAYTGELWIDGECMVGKADSRLAAVRNEKIGFVFQFHYLLNEFTVLKNVMLPALKLGKENTIRIREKAFHWLDVLQMAPMVQKRPNELSGGEKQRVAIARALINDPHIIMADEPTGNLDKINSGIVLDTFSELISKFQQTLLVVTHDTGFASRTQRIVEMEDGRILTSPEVANAASK